MCQYGPLPPRGVPAYAQAHHGGIVGARHADAHTQRDKHCALIAGRKPVVLSLVCILKLPATGTKEKTELDGCQGTMYRVSVQMCS